VRVWNTRAARHIVAHRGTSGLIADGTLLLAGYSIQERFNADIVMMLYRFGGEDHE